MKTTSKWWSEVSADETKMTEWLKAQYHGEVTAESRIREAIQRFELYGLEAMLIKAVADDEAKHAVWVGSLLTARGIQKEVLQKEERYWNAVLPQDLEENTFEYFCAVGHLAETMRLERISLLSSDVRFMDIAKVMQDIYPDEVFHARVFKEMSTPSAIARAFHFHNIGKNAIGLLP